MNRIVSIIFGITIVAALAVAVWMALDFDSIQARLFPLVIGIVSLVLALIEVGKDLRRAGAGSAGAAMDLGFDEASTPSFAQSLVLLGWLFGFLLLTFLFGFFVSVPVFIFANLVVSAGVSPKRALVITAFACAIVLGVLHGALGLALPEGMLTDVQRF